MYAEITLYDDDGTIKNKKPYVIPASSIYGYTHVIDECKIVDHEFKFVWTERIPRDPTERERAAYEKGREAGREEIERYYAGGRSIPAPLKIVKHYGKGDLYTIANEILGFTKMNWNSFNLYTKLPATLDSSSILARVGKLLSKYEGKTYDYRYFI